MFSSNRFSILSNPYLNTEYLGVHLPKVNDENSPLMYKDFRKARAELRDEGKELDSLVLAKYLNNYAETGEKYVEVLQKIIEQNNLKDFDDAKLLPSSIELESLI